MNIAVLGCGVVGGGLVKLCEGRKDLSVKKILDLREFPELSIPVTKDYSEIVNDPEIDIVVETMGGFKPAFDFAEAVLKAGKHFVTANKQMIAAGFDTLVPLAIQKGLGLRCTAAAGGGIPWLYELARAAEVDEILNLSGIMNGTTNYILDRMTKEGADFGEVLKEAQKLGFAEADPTADIDGWDIRRKLLLSANIAFGVSMKEEDIPMLGIRHVSAEDIAAFKEKGMVLRIIGSAEKTARGIAASVIPTVFEETDPEAAVGGCFNRFSFAAARIGNRAFYGQGAGSLPTAANVLRDCMDIEAGFRGFYRSDFKPAQPDSSSTNEIFYVRTADPKKFDAVKDSDFGPGILTKPMALSEILPLLSGEDFVAKLAVYL